jgi:hypothetical protein
VTEEAVLQFKLSTLGECVPLKLRIDSDLYFSEISQFNDNWRPYNPRKSDHRRHGLSLTSLDGQFGGPDLDSIYEYNSQNKTNLREASFKEATDALTKTTCFNAIKENFDLGRSHILRFDKGGFFPPHRDSFGLSDECFRIVCPLENASWNELGFVLNEKQLRMNPWRFYYLDTSKVHSVFSFVDNSALLVLNVLLNEKNYYALLKNLETI